VNVSRQEDLPPEPVCVSSADGTTIGYFTFGGGASVIVIPGALSTAADYFRFARALANHFTVHVIERRGRGVSGPQGDDYGIERECEDLMAVQAATGATRLVGHSFGGLIALETTRRHSVFDQVVLYEPGVSIEGCIPMGWMSQYEQLLAHNRPLDAFAVFSMGTGPDKGRRTPLWLMKLLLPLFITRRRRETMFTLLQQNLLEHGAVQACDNHLDSYSTITAPVLIMRGAKTGIRWVRQTTERLAEILPTSESREFPKLNHFGIDQGNPEEVAHAASHFFLG
jgi:pimeloyl-ACP methyl ester carboxylesterase